MKSIPSKSKIRIILLVVAMVACFAVLTGVLAKGFIFDNPKITDPRQENKVVFVSKALDCWWCKHQLRWQLRNQPGIQKISFIPTENKVAITYKRGQTTIKSLKDRLEYLGYPAEIPDDQSKIEIIQYQVKFQ